MTNPTAQLAESHDVSAKVVQLLKARTKLAIERYGARVKDAFETAFGAAKTNPIVPWQVSAGAAQYAVDFAQRSILFWDTLRQRGNNFLEHERQGLPPVLHFDSETIMDGRSFARPVNYALLRIVPPKGVAVDPNRRPYVIIDPRGGHGPGIGGFKDDSQVGVALHEGHPVYFVVFFPNPEPGQTLLDVCNAEREFVHRVRELHPNAEKPAIVGNCQAGWAAMMLAASHPDDTGPVVIVGAPMSYWSGAWREGAGDNPMRYAGGLLGGTWLSSLASDVGNGKFDGAYLVQNFENMNLANTFWDKYYNVFANIDTEPPRFLEFERWWGGYFLMNREEIEWITQNLFVGNKVWSGAVKAGSGEVFDLRDIKVPIVLFASLGDNITPPQQAFNWVADVYGSTDEIKARGQVIVGLMHEDIGHLGIFVSGKVAKKEHAQIVSVLKSIEALPPGLYGMQIAEANDGGKPSYDVSFVELRLEEVVKRMNRFKREDEKPFAAVNAIAEFNQRAYELFGRPLVKAHANEYGAKLSRVLHPLRAQRWAFSDLNPALWWLAPRCQGSEGAPPRDLRRPSDTPARIDGVGVDERCARLPARAARRRSPKRRSSRSTATSPLSTLRTTKARKRRRYPPTRASFPSSRKRWPPSAKADTRKRSHVSPSSWRTRTSLSRFPACSSRTTCSKNTANCCRTFRSTRRDVSAASRKSLRAMNRTRRSRRCPCCFRTRTTAIACSPCSIACWATSACKRSSPRPQQKRDARTHSRRARALDAAKAPKRRGNGSASRQRRAIDERNGSAKRVARTRDACRTLSEAARREHRWRLPPCRLAGSKPCSVTALRSACAQSDRRQGTAARRVRAAVGSQRVSPLLSSRKRAHEPMIFGA